MNNQNAFKVADLIEQHQEQFDMCGWGPDLNIHDCNTAGCVAGFSATLEKSQDSVHLKAERVLGLTKEEAASLFLGKEVWAKYADELGLPIASGNIVNLADIKPQHAVIMLRNLASGRWSF